MTVRYSCTIDGVLTALTFAFKENAVFRQTILNITDIPAKFVGDFLSDAQHANTTEVAQRARAKLLLQSQAFGLHNILSECQQDPTKSAATFTAVKLICLLQ